MKSKATRRVLRCPHILEVFASYGFIFIMMQYICAVKLQSPITQQIALTIVGLFVYSFLEYIFHRVILHIWLKTIHDNHHARPAYLHIIGTPIIPVFLYGFFFSSILMLLFGNQYAWAMNSGVALGQLIMDSLHILFHSKFSPKCLIIARSYHAYHHFVNPKVAHGLTSSFWDAVFGTFPFEWPIYQKYPMLYYAQLPIPFLSFFIFAMTIDRSHSHLFNHDKFLQIQPQNNIKNSRNGSNNNNYGSDCGGGSSSLHSSGGGEKVVNKLLGFLLFDVNKMKNMMEYLRTAKVEYIIQSWSFATLLVLMWPIN